MSNDISLKLTSASASEVHSDSVMMLNLCRQYLFSLELFCLCLYLDYEISVDIRQKTLIYHHVNEIHNNLV